jgi:hypothetical protein
MNANELAEDLEGAKLVILRLNDMLRQQQAEIEALKLQNDNYWVMIEILRQRLRENPLQDRFDKIAAGVVFGKAQEK